MTNLLREIRESKGLSGRELAKRSGLSPAFISRMERGERNISIHQLEKLAEALSVTPGDLVERQLKPFAIPYLGEATAEGITKDGFMPDAFSFDFDKRTHVVVEVKTSFEGFVSGDHLFAKRMDSTEDALNKLCIVKIEGIEKPVIRRLIAGSKVDRFTLVGSTETLTDIKVDWVALILFKLQSVS